MLLTVLFPTDIIEIDYSDAISMVARVNSVSGLCCIVAERRSDGGSLLAEQGRGLCAVVLAYVAEQQLPVRSGVFAQVTGEGLSCVMPPQVQVQAFLLDAVDES